MQVPTQVISAPALEEVRKEATQSRSAEIIPRASKQLIEDDLNEVGADMAERLTKQLTNETYECMVCCEAIRVDNHIWACSNCHHVFHLICIKVTVTKLVSPFAE